jgi:hypothetical protein
VLPVSMICPANVNLSTMAAHSRGSVNTLPRPASRTSIAVDQKREKRRQRGQAMICCGADVDH